jgi:hypothetical protein
MWKENNTEWEISNFYFSLDNIRSKESAVHITLGGKSDVADITETECLGVGWIHLAQIGSDIEHGNGRSNFL